MLYRTVWVLDAATPKGGIIIQKVSFIWDAYYDEKRDKRVKDLNVYFLGDHLSDLFDENWYPYLGGTDELLPKESVH